MRSALQQSERRDLAPRIERNSPSAVTSFNRAGLRKILTVFRRELSGAPSKTLLLNAVLQPQSAIKEGTIQLDEISDEATPEEAALNGRARDLLLKLKEASLHA